MGCFFPKACKQWRKSIITTKSYLSPYWICSRNRVLRGHHFHLPQGLVTPFWTPMNGAASHSIPKKSLVWTPVSMCWDMLGRKPRKNCFSWSNAIVFGRHSQWKWLGLVNRVPILKIPRRRFELAKTNDFSEHHRKQNAKTHWRI